MTLKGQDRHRRVGGREDSCGVGIEPDVDVGLQVPEATQHVEVVGHVDAITRRPGTSRRAARAERQPPAIPRGDRHRQLHLRRVVDRHGGVRVARAFSENVRKTRVDNTGRVKAEVWPDADIESVEPVVLLCELQRQAKLRRQQPLVRKRLGDVKAGIHGQIRVHRAVDDVVDQVVPGPRCVGPKAVLHGVAEGFSREDGIKRITVGLELVQPTLEHLDQSQRNRDNDFGPRGRRHHLQCDVGAVASPTSHRHRPCIKEQALC